MSHHLHLLTVAFGITMPRQAAVESAVRRWAQKRTKGLPRVGVQTFLRLTEYALRRERWNYATVVAEIRAEFARMVGDKP